MERVQHVNRIKGLLFSQGASGYEPLRRDRRARLDALQTGDGRRLPQHLNAQVCRELDRLELLLEQIKAVEAERDALLDAEQTKASTPPPMLLGVHGVGPEFASVLWSKGLSRRFENRRQVAAYAGLAPTPWQSGSVNREQGISQSGNRRLRTMTIQLAWLWLRHQPRSALTLWFKMLCSRGLCQTGKPHIWNRSACMSSNVCHQIIYLAIELSSSSWVIAYRVPRNDKAKLHRLEAGDGAGLLAFIAGLRHRLDPPDDASTLVVSCFEAGRDGFWLHRLLTAHGVINHVVEPTSILVTRGARRAKTDRLDAVGLLRVLAARFAGDPGACRTVVVPSVEEEDAKRPHREREFLVQERVRIENRIAALLATQGVRGRPSLRSWDADMRALRTGDGRPLPTHLVAELNRLRRRLSLTLEMIRELDAVREQALEAQHDSASRTVKALCTIRGIGVNFASVLTREVFYRTFDNRWQIASYLGLAPTPFQSGGMDRDRRINRAGNSRARKTLVQLAWLWLRYQPESSHAAWFRDRVGSLQGRIRRITIVALARKLLIAIWRFVTLGLAPEGAIIAA